MNCCDDEGYHEYVLGPLKHARQDLDWILKQAQRGSLTPQLMQKAIREVGQKLKTADNYFEGLLLE